MSDLFENIVNHFENAEVLYKPNPEDRSIWALLSGNEATWTTLVRAEDEWLEVVAIHPLRIPEDKRAALAELIIRIGPRNNCCRLEMEYDEGRLTARTRLNITSGVDLCEEEIFATISIPLNALECLHRTVVAILHQGKSAVEAIQLLEEEDEPEIPHANRFNLPKPEGNVPWPELPEEGLWRN